MPGKSGPERDNRSRSLTGIEWLQLMQQQYPEEDPIISESIRKSYQQNVDKFESLGSPRASVEISSSSSATPSDLRRRFRSLLDRVQLSQSLELGASQELLQEAEQQHPELYRSYSEVQTTSAAPQQQPQQHRPIKRSTSELALKSSGFVSGEEEEHVETATDAAGMSLSARMLSPDHADEPPRIGQEKPPFDTSFDELSSYNRTSEGSWKGARPLGSPLEFSSPIPSAAVFQPGRYNDIRDDNDSTAATSTATENTQEVTDSLTEEQKTGLGNADVSSDQDLTSLSNDIDLEGHRESSIIDTAARAQADRGNNDGQSITGSEQDVVEDTEEQSSVEGDTSQQTSEDPELVPPSSSDISEQQTSEEPRSAPQHTPDTYEQQTYEVPSSVPSTTSDSSVKPMAQEPPSAPPSTTNTSEQQASKVPASVPSTTSDSSVMPMAQEPPSAPPSTTDTYEQQASEVPASVPSITSDSSVMPMAQEPKSAPPSTTDTYEQQTSVVPASVPSITSDSSVKPMAQKPPSAPPSTTDTSEQQTPEVPASVPSATSDSSVKPMAQEPRSAPPSTTDTSEQQTSEVPASVPSATSDSSVMPMTQEPASAPPNTTDTSEQQTSEVHVPASIPSATSDSSLMPMAQEPTSAPPSTTDTYEQQTSVVPASVPSITSDSSVKPMAQEPPSAPPSTTDTSEQQTPEVPLAVPSTASDSSVKSMAQEPSAPPSSTDTSEQQTSVVPASVPSTTSDSSEKPMAEDPSAPPSTTDTSEQQTSVVPASVPSTTSDSSVKPMAEDPSEPPLNTTDTSEQQTSEVQASVALTTSDSSEMPVAKDPSEARQSISNICENQTEEPPVLAPSTSGSSQSNQGSAHSVNKQDVPEQKSLADYLVCVSDGSGGLYCKMMQVPKFAPDEPEVEIDWKKHSMEYIASGYCASQESVEFDPHPVDNDQLLHLLPAGKSERQNDLSSDDDDDADSLKKSRKGKKKKSKTMEVAVDHDDANDACDEKIRSAHERFYPSRQGLQVDDGDNENEAEIPAEKKLSDLVFNPDLSEFEGNAHRNSSTSMSHVDSFTVTRVAQQRHSNSELIDESSGSSGLHSALVHDTASRTRRDSHVRFHDRVQLSFYNVSDADSNNLVLSPADTPDFTAEANRDERPLNDTEDQNRTNTCTSPRSVPTFSIQMLQHRQGSAPTIAGSREPMEGEVVTSQNLAMMDGQMETMVFPSDQEQAINDYFLQMLQEVMTAVVHRQTVGETLEEVDEDNGQEEAAERYAHGEGEGIGMPVQVHVVDDLEIDSETEYVQLVDSDDEGFHQDSHEVVTLPSDQFLQQLPENTQVSIPTAYIEIQDPEITVPVDAPSTVSYCPSDDHSDVTMEDEINPNILVLRSRDRLGKSGMNEVILAVEDIVRSDMEQHSDAEERNNSKGDDKPYFAPISSSLHDQTRMHVFAPRSVESEPLNGVVTESESSLPASSREQCDDAIDYLFMGESQSSIERDPSVTEKPVTAPMTEKSQNETPDTGKSLGNAMSLGLPSEAWNSASVIEDMWINAILPSEKSCRVKEDEDSTTFDKHFPFFSQDETAVVKQSIEEAHKSVDPNEESDEEYVPKWPSCGSFSITEKAFTSVDDVSKLSPEFENERHQPYFAPETQSSSSEEDVVAINKLFEETARKESPIFEHKHRTSSVILDLLHDACQQDQSAVNMTDLTAVPESLAPVHATGSIPKPRAASTPHMMSTSPKEHEQWHQKVKPVYSLQQSDFGSDKEVVTSATHPQETCVSTVGTSDASVGTSHASGETAQLTGWSSQTPIGSSHIRSGTSQERGGSSHTGSGTSQETDRTSHTRSWTSQETGRGSHTSGISQKTGRTSDAKVGTSDATVGTPYARSGTSQEMDGTSHAISKTSQALVETSHARSGTSQETDSATLPAFKRFLALNIEENEGISRAVESGTKIVEVALQDLKGSECAIEKKASSTADLLKQHVGTFDEEPKISELAAHIGELVKQHMVRHPDKTETMDVATSAASLVQNHIGTFTDDMGPANMASSIADLLEKHVSFYVENEEAVYLTESISAYVNHYIDGFLQELTSVIAEPSTSKASDIALRKTHTRSGTSQETDRTSNAALGTSDTRSGTSQDAVGTSHARSGTSDATVWNSRTRSGTSKDPVGTSDATVGTSDAAVRTSQEPVWTSDVAVGTSYAQSAPSHETSWTSQETGWTSEATGWSSQATGWSSQETGWSSQATCWSSQATDGTSQATVGTSDATVRSLNEDQESSQSQISEEADHHAEYRYSDHSAERVAKIGTSLPEMASSSTIKQKCIQSQSCPIKVKKSDKQEPATPPPSLKTSANLSFHTPVSMLSLNDEIDSSDFIQPTVKASPPDIRLVGYGQDSFTYARMEARIAANLANIHRKQHHVRLRAMEEDDIMEDPKEKVEADDTEIILLFPEIPSEEPTSCRLPEPAYEKRFSKEISAEIHGTSEIQDSVAGLDAFLELNNLSDLEACVMNLDHLTRDMRNHIDTGVVPWQSLKEVQEPRDSASLPTFKRFLALKMVESEGMSQPVESGTKIVEVALQDLKGSECAIEKKASSTADLLKQHVGTFDEEPKISELAAHIGELVKQHMVRHPDKTETMDVATSAASLVQNHIGTFTDDMGPAKMASSIADLLEKHVGFYVENEEAVYLTASISAYVNHYIDGLLQELTSYAIVEPSTSKVSDIVASSEMEIMTSDIVEMKESEKFPSKTDLSGKDQSVQIAGLNTSDTGTSIMHLAKTDMSTLTNVIDTSSSGTSAIHLEKADMGSLAKTVDTFSSGTSAMHLVKADIGSLANTVDTSSSGTSAMHLDKADMGSLAKTVDTYSSGTSAMHLVKADIGSLANTVDTSSSGTSAMHLDKADMGSLAKTVDTYSSGTSAMHLVKADIGSLANTVDTSSSGTSAMHLAKADTGSLTNKIDTSSSGTSAMHLVKADMASLTNRAETSSSGTSTMHLAKADMGSLTNRVDTTAIGTCVSGLNQDNFGATTKGLETLSAYTSVSNLVKSDATTLAAQVNTCAIATSVAGLVRAEVASETQGLETSVQSTSVCGLVKMDMASTASILQRSEMATDVGGLEVHNASTEVYGLDVRDKCIEAVCVEDLSKGTDTIDFDKKNIETSTAGLLKPPKVLDSPSNATGKSDLVMDDIVKQYRKMYEDYAENNSSKPSKRQKAGCYLIKKTLIQQRAQKNKPPDEAETLEEMIARIRLRVQKAYERDLLMDMDDDLFCDLESSHINVWNVRTSTPYRHYDKTATDTTNSLTRPVTCCEVSGSPSSRGASPTPDAVLGSTRGKSPGSDARSFMVEKEVIESQLRKVEVENASLRGENKLVKDKYNRAMTRCETLEKQLYSATSEADSKNTEVAHLKSVSQHDHDALQERVIQLMKQVEILKAENASLQNELAECHSKKISTNSSERSRIIHGFKTQNNLLKDELRDVKEHLAKSEREAAEELNKRKEASNQVVRLTEMKALLQQQLEEGGAGTVAEKQVKSLEMRLRVTEERLHQERADRAGKLSQVEEKLINENAKLQVSEKEVKRQFMREQNKTRTLENKLREAKNEPSVSNTPKDDPYILKREVEQLREQVEDRTAQKNDLHDKLSHEVAVAIEDKHSMEARLKMLEDLNAGLRAENTSLNNYLLPTASTASTAASLEQLHTWQAKVEATTSENSRLRSEALAKDRQNTLLDTELLSVRGQLTAKEESLDEALRQLDNVVGAPPDNHRMDQLKAQIKGLEAEVELWRQKFDSLYHKYQQELSTVQVQQQHQQQLMATQVPESEKLALENEVREKEHELAAITGRYNEVENQLQRTKQQMLRVHEQEEVSNQQLESIQSELRQQKRESAKWNSAEADYKAQIQAIRENLVTNNNELTTTSSQLKLKKTEMQLATEKINKLDRDVTERDRQLGLNIARAIANGEIKSVLYSETAKTSVEVLAEADYRVRTLEQGMENHSYDMQKRDAAIESLTSEQATTEGHARESHQELLTERARLCQLTAEKSDAEQKLQAREEELSVLTRQRAGVEQQLVRQEVATAQLADRLREDIMESEELKQLEQEMEQLGPQGKKAALELASSRRLLEAREHEISLLTDTIQRQKVENDGHGRKIQILKEENLANRDDIENLTTQLTIKMKEHSSVAEQGQSLGGQLSKLKLQKVQLEKDISRDSHELERKNTELSQLRNKLDAKNERLRQSEEDQHEKETKLVAVETELVHVRRSLRSLEDEKSENISLTSKLAEDIRSLSQLSTNLEDKLTTESTSLDQEKSTKLALRDELSEMSRQMDMVKHEYNRLQDSLQSERTRQRDIQTECESVGEQKSRLDERLRTQALELETLRAHLTEARTNTDALRQEKQALYTDVQDLCRKVADRDDTISRQQEKSGTAIETLQKDYSQEKVRLIEETHRLQDSLSQVREELDDVREKMRQKDLQLASTYRTNKDLEEEAHARGELEDRVLELESQVNEARRNVTSLTLDNKRLTETGAHLQESLDQMRESNVSLREQLRSQRETLSAEVQMLTIQVREEQHQQENSRMTLQDELNRTIANFKATEVSLAAANETKEGLYASNRELEKSVTEIRTQLHEESTSRRLAEQRVESLTTQMEEGRSKRSGDDARSTELQSLLNKADQDLALHKEKYRKLKQDFTDIQSTCYAHEANNHSLNTQVTQLTADITSLRSAVESQRQTLGGRAERLELELRQQQDQAEKDRNRMLLQIQQISNDLDNANSQIANKNRENLALQERILKLESDTHDTSVHLSSATEAVKMESETRVKLDQRNMELELLVAKLRSSRDHSNAESYDATRSEVSRMMSELSRRLQEQLDAQRNADSQARAIDEKKLKHLKERLTAMESSLSQEQALHIVTKTSLSSVEEDNSRLRQQLATVRRRHQPAGDRNKSRIEEINEIIARSQVQAQQMLEASGHVSSLSPRGGSTPRYSSLAVNGHSPDTSFASDDVRLYGIGKQ